MTLQIALMLGLVAVTLVCFVREIFPIEVTALGLLAVLLASGAITLDEAIAGFSNKAVIAIGGLLVMSHALTHTGLLETAADRLGRRLGRRAWPGISAFLVVVALLSAFLNNTAVVALFIPLTMSLCQRVRVSPSKVLLPLSYVTIFGGTLTLVGTSTNLLMASVIEGAGLAPMTMFELTPMGAVFLATGLAYTLAAAPRMLPARVEPGDLTAKYRLGAYLTEIQIREGSALAGKTAREMALNEHYGVNVLAILRQGERFTQDVGRMVLQPGDLLIVQGTVDSILRMRRDLGVALLPDIKLTDSELAVGGQMLAEVLVTPTSDVVGQTVEEVDFRGHYGGFVLAIRRLGTTLREKVAHTRLHAADTLLMWIPRERLEELRRSEELVVLSELPAPLRRRRAWWLVLVVLPLVVGLAAFGFVEIAGGALLGAIALLVAGAVPPREAYQAIDWSVLFLIAAFVPVSDAFHSTGTADFLASGILRAGRLFPEEMAPLAVLAIIYLLTAVLTQLVSNAAAALIVSPIGLSAAASLGVDPRPFLIAVCYAASAGFMTPVGYQTNMMVFGPGGYRFMDSVRFGAPLTLLFWLLAALLIPHFWPF